jgi:hypothetical protein
VQPIASDRPADGAAARCSHTIAVATASHAPSVIAAACWAIAAGCVSVPAYLWIRRVRATSASRPATP